MKEEVNLEQLEYIVKEMKKIQAENPKANVLYDFSKNRINIIYPLPKDYYELVNYKFENK